MLTKGAVGNLINRYKAFLKKCHLINTFGSLAVAAMLVVGGAGMAMGDESVYVPAILEQDTVLTETDSAWFTRPGSQSLDLNGHSLSSEGDNGYLGNNSASQDALIIVNRGSHLTIDDSGSNGLIETENLACGIKLTVKENEGDEAASLTVNGGTIRGKFYGIAGNGTRHNTNININGGTIESIDGTAIYHPQNGVMNVSGGSITGQDAGIEIRSGTLNISGGTITSTSADYTSAPNGNGTTVSGAALGIVQHTTKLPIEVNITGGTFKGLFALYEENLQDNDADSIDEVKVSIADGNFIGEIYSEDCRDFITGGTFSSPTALDYLGQNADVNIVLEKGYDSAEDYRADGDSRPKGQFTIKETQKVAMEFNGYGFKTDSLAVKKGGVLSIDMPDNGGLSPSSDTAFLALGHSLDIGAEGIGKLQVGNVADDSADVAFGADSVLVVDGKVATEGAFIKGQTQTISVADGSKLYIADAQAGKEYKITDGLSGTYWSGTNLLANHLIEASIDENGVVMTEARDAASALPGVIAASSLNAMMTDGLNNSDSQVAGIRFLSRAIEELSVADATAAINEVSRAAVTAGVQNTALRLADAGVEHLTHHLSLSFFGKENNIHKDGVDIWATPMYGNTYMHGMAVSGTSVRGNYGGMALGADAEVGEMLGGKVCVGMAVNGGGGKSETSGTVTSTDNEYGFGGVNLYAGWNTGNLNIMGSVGYAMADHDVKMNLPSVMEMGQAKADVDTNAFIADLRAEYQLNTSVVDILPHAGVRYTALNTERYDLKVNGSTLNSVASDTQHIVQFPVGVTLSKDMDVSGWNVKPQLDVSVIPAAGEKKNTTKVSYSGIGSVDSVNTRIMDSTSWAGMVGVQAEKGNFALGLNYGVQASSHETDQGVSVGFSWKF